VQTPAGLGFALHLAQRVARDEKVRVQVGAAVRCDSEVAVLACGFESVMHHVAAGLHVAHPAHDESGVFPISARLEAGRPALSNEIIAELAESKSRLTIAETWSGNPSERDKGEARTVAVATLEPKIDAVQVAKESKFRSVKKAGGNSLVRTLTVASVSGSVISGESLTSSIARPPTCHQISSYSSRASSSVGCGDHAMPTCRR
jgi:hypothetical protein